MPQELHRTRSRSPHRSERRSKNRSRSPHDRHRRVKPRVERKALPFGARDLSRYDLSAFRPMFALYLDIQKQIYIDDLDEKEVKGRWKSFVGKWNGGELAEGWYDPQTFEKANASSIAEPASHGPTSHMKRRAASPDEDRDPREAEDDDDDDGYGPAPPQYTSDSQHISVHNASKNRPSAGASIPTLSDLRDRDEDSRLTSSLARTSEYTTLQAQRQLDRKEQKTRLDELAPRAEPGTRERQLEKKRELAESNRAFSAAKDAGGDVELRDAEVMGDEDSLGELKRMKRENERKKNEREIRKEEILRARKAERDARLAGLKEKEDRTMQMFKEIARARFGGGGAGEEE